MPIVIKGEAAGVKQEGGIIEQILREVEVECLPGDIPASIEADVSELVFGKVMRVSDLTQTRRRSKFVTDANQPVAHVTTVKEEVVPTADAVAADAARLQPSRKLSRRASRKRRGEEGAVAAPEKPEKPEKKEKK